MLVGWRGVRDDLVDAGAAPVFGVHSGQDDQAAGVAKPAGRRPRGVVDRVRLGGVRRADQRGAEAGGVGEDQVGGTQLQPGAQGAGPAQVHMGRGVVADLVATRKDLVHEAWMLGGLRAGYEERGVHTVPGEHIQDHGCPLWIWAVIEGERDRVFRRSQGHRRVPARVDDRTTGAHRGRHVGGRTDGDGGFGAKRAGQHPAQREQPGDRREQRGQQQPVGARWRRRRAVTAHGLAGVGGQAGRLARW